MTERADVTGSGLSDMIVAAISYADINAGDTPSVSTVFHHFNYKSAAGADVTASLNAAQLAAINKVSVPLVVAQDPGQQEFRYGARDLQCG